MGGVAAQASLPPRIWVDLQCAVAGQDHELTEYYERDDIRPRLLCGDPETKTSGWEHIKFRHGENGAGIRWSDELAQFSNYPVAWHYLMDWATAVTISEHSAGIFTRPTSTCYMHDFTAILPSGTTTKRVAVIIDARGGPVVTSFPTDNPNYFCGGSPTEPLTPRGEGPATTTMNCGLIGAGCFTHLSNGKSIYFSPDTGSQLVRGVIRNRYESLGWERSFLVYPTTNERCGLLRSGCFNHFQGGSIYFSPNTGAWPVGGAFRDAWASKGWERSPFGYPITGEKHPGGEAPANHRVQQFEYGFLYWNGSSVTGEWQDPVTQETHRARIGG